MFRMCLSTLNGKTHNRLVRVLFDREGMPDCKRHPVTGLDSIRVLDLNTKRTQYVSETFLRPTRS